MNKEIACPCVTKEGEKPQYPDKTGLRCKQFTCKNCGKKTPWCCGGDGPDCDDCWADKQKAREIILRRFMGRRYQGVTRRSLFA